MSAALPSSPIERATRSRRHASTLRSASSRLVVASSRYRVASRRSMRVRIDFDRRAPRAPFIVAASGWAPPMPPRPAVTTSAPAQRAAEMAARRGGERLVGALQDPLGSDVDPASGRHLAVHRQAAMLEVAERLPGRPGRHEQRVGDQHARRAGVRAEDADRLARLHEQRLVVLESRSDGDDRVERLPVARRLARAAVDDEIVGALGDVGIEIVHQHAQRGFLRPALARECSAARRSDDARADGHADGVRWKETARTRRSEVKKRARACQMDFKKSFS